MLEFKIRRGFDWRMAQGSPICCICSFVCGGKAVGSLFKALHEREKVVDLVWIELKGRHGGVAGIDPLRKGLREHLDFVAQMEVAERGSNLQWTRIEPIYGVTARAVCLRENETAPLPG